jgi:TPR repeat protein
MLYRLLILFVSVLLLGCNQTRSRTHLAAQKFYSGAYHSAFRDALIAARAGDAQSQYALGYMYYYGKGVIADDQHATYWFRKAAKQGHRDAKRALQLLGQAALQRD